MGLQTLVDVRESFTGEAVGIDHEAEGRMLQGQVFYDDGLFPQQPASKLVAVVANQLASKDAVNRLGGKKLEDSISGIHTPNPAGTASVLIEQECRLVLVGLRGQGIPQLVVADALCAQDFKKLRVCPLDLAEGPVVCPFVVLPYRREEQVAPSVYGVDATHRAGIPSRRRTRSLMKMSWMSSCSTASVLMAVT